MLKYVIIFYRHYVANSSKYDNDSGSFKSEQLGVLFPIFINNLSIIKTYLCIH